MKGIKVAEQQGAIVSSCKGKSHTREAFICLFKNVALQILTVGRNPELKYGPVSAYKGELS